MKELYERTMVRCSVPTCRRWWSQGVPNRAAPGPERCPCGGVLEVVDMKAHIASLPYVPHDPSKK